MYTVYILSNAARNLFYISATKNLKADLRKLDLDRANGTPDPRLYGCYDLMYWEEVGTQQEATKLEIEIKAFSTRKKLALIHELNPRMIAFNAAIMLE